jgi:hypothetical protein
MASLLNTLPKNKIPSGVLHLCIGLLMMSANLSAQNFKPINVSYKLNGKDASNTIYIPQYAGEIQPPVRGVMQNVGGPLKSFAHKSQVAMIARLDEGRGFSKALLAAAAKASNQPEIEFAGAIVQGISKGGRAAADWAAANQGRAIAVILDHSAIWRMDFPKRVSGVPMYFNATHADLFQNIDRRKSHFGWCAAAFNAKQPCTAVIDIAEKGGHGGRGTTTLTAIWLEEVMNLRVPANIPVGRAYQLINVNPSAVGGYVSAKLSKEGKRTYHDNVKITVKQSGSTWWIPGPKSAAMYSEWVRSNGGSVEKDESAQIKNAPVFLDLPPELRRAAESIEAEKWSQAYAALKKSKNQEDHFAKTLVNKVNTQVEGHLALLDKQKSVGDVYSIYANFQKYSQSYKGIPAYDKVFKNYASFFKADENQAQLKLGREFHSIINRMNTMKRASETGLEALEKFAQDHTETVHGKAAKKAFEKISEDSSLKQSAESYYLDLL